MQFDLVIFDCDGVLIDSELLSVRADKECLAEDGIDLSAEELDRYTGISLAAMTHLAAATPNLDYACDTHYPWRREDVIAGSPLRFSSGSIRVPDAPGLGVELDRAKLEFLHQRWLDDDGSLRERDDAAAMRITDPEWVTPSMPRW